MAHKLAPRGLLLLFGCFNLLRARLFAVAGRPAGRSSAADGAQLHGWLMDCRDVETVAGWAKNPLQSGNTCQP
eukprot:COSAG01_NODE_23707_length_803_cov_2.146099_1_plen_73_part_00